jgi:hypothetical protein
MLRRQDHLSTLPACENTSEAPHLIYHCHFVLPIYNNCQIVFDLEECKAFVDDDLQDFGLVDEFGARTSRYIGRFDLKPHVFDDEK